MITEMLQHQTISERLKKLTMDEKLVNYDITIDNWDITYVYKEMVWVKRLDEPDANFILSKGGLTLTPGDSKSPYAICEVIMTGPDVKVTKPGDFVMIPKVNCAANSQKIVDGYKTYFVREDGIMAGIKFKGNAEDIKTDIEQNILLK